MGESQLPFIPYGRQLIEDDDVRAVLEVLRSDWLTTGPKIEEFENAVAAFVGARHGVAVSSGTAGLHSAMAALGIGPGDEVIVPTMTFVATANVVLFQGGTPVLCDVDADTLLIDVSAAAAAITERTKAIIAVDYAGQPANYAELQQLCDRHGLALVADACHAIGGTYEGRPVGSLADLTVFSFHPVKHMTTGEGGMVVTDNDDYARLMRRFRNHGIVTDHRERTAQGTWFYEMVDLGYNYRLTDLQCALGISQLAKLPTWLERRRDIARTYDRGLATVAGVTPLVTAADRGHAYHLFVVRIDLDGSPNRDAVFDAMRRRGIGVNVHYIPVHMHPYYRNRFPDTEGMLPVAEAAYKQVLSLPMHHSLEQGDLERVFDVFAGLRDS